MTLRTLRVAPKYEGQIAPLSEDCCSKLSCSEKDLLQQGQSLSKPLFKAWRADKHLAFPSMRHAYVLQSGSERIVYSKAPVYAEGGSAKCYIGQKDDGTFCLVRRVTHFASEAARRGALRCEIPESETRQIFAADLAPWWRLAKASRKAPGAFKLYAVEPLLVGPAYGLSRHVKRADSRADFALFVHHFMQGVATQLAAMHGGFGTMQKRSKAYAHNDVKADNVCMQRITDESQAMPLRFRLIDFELASAIGAYLPASNVNVRPHELVQGDGICRADADMFSFGLACMQLILDKEPYQELVAQNNQTEDFDRRHLQVLAQFEAARSAVVEGLGDSPSFLPLVRRFVAQWQDMQSSVPPYLVEIIQGCVAWGGLNMQHRRLTAQQVLDKLAAHPLPDDAITSLRERYARFCDDKQTVCKISAAILAGAVRKRVSAADAKEVARGPG